MQGHQREEEAAAGEGTGPGPLPATVDAAATAAAGHPPGAAGLGATVVVQLDQAAEVFLQGVVLPAPRADPLQG